MPMFDESVAAKFGQAFRAVVERHGQAPRIVVANAASGMGASLRRSQ